MTTALRQRAPGVRRDAAAPRPGTRLRAGLVYSSDAQPGITRLPRGDRFVYRDAAGRAVRDQATLERIRRLAIPPAYGDVWICARADGHLQATGRDARGRKQYRYHADWQALRGEDKFARLEAFGRALPRIRARVQRDLQPAGVGRAGSVAPAVTRDMLLATIVRLLDATFVRVGNEEYARANKSYGLTTLRNRHAGVQGATLRLRFRGKSGVMHEVRLEDRRVAAVVRRCQRLPGQELFQYEDEHGAPHRIGSGDVNDYLAAVAGGAFTAKDFRTWHGSVLALELTRLACGAPGAGPQAAAGVGTGVAAGTGAGAGAGADASAGEDADRAVRFSAQAVLAQVARRLGNTPAVCRKAYVHPAVLELGSRLAADAGEMARFAAADADARPPRAGGLSAAERRFAAFLRSARPRRGAAGRAAGA